MATPDVLVIGNLVKDLTASGWRFGGGVAYAASQAARLGLRVAALTRCEAAARPADDLPEVEWRLQASTTTTTFENRYVANKREQWLRADAGPIDLDDLPAEWRAAPIVLLAPVFHEIDAEAVARWSPDAALLGIGAQGWLRSAPSGRVEAGQIEPRPRWLGGDVIFVSEEDAADAEGVAVWQSESSIVVLTRAERGCSLWDEAGRQDIEPFEAVVVDATGAGDSFAAAFLVARQEGRDVVEAARFAAAAGALAVRGEGAAALGDRAAIERLLRTPVHG